MPLVHLITTGHGDHTVVGDMNLAFHHVARMLCPTGDHIARFGLLDEFPMLAAAGCPGSFYHRVRYGVEEGVDGRGFETLAIETHDTAAAPGMASEVDCYDLVSAPDPSYEVMRALFIAEETDTALDEIAEGLEGRVAGIAADGRRLGEDDRAFVARLRGYQGTFLGPEVVPPGMTDAEVLRLLPALAVEAFRTVAAKAFPADAPPEAAAAR